MELTREHFRAMIFYDFKDGLTRQQCSQKIKRLFGNEAPSLATVERWFNAFQRGRVSLKDEHREGRPATAVTPENIDAVCTMIKADNYCTYRDIQASLGIGMTQIRTILHDHLAVRKLCARWIPHNLTQAQKKARVDWCKKMLKKFNRGQAKSVYDVTDDETWIYCYEPESKRQSAQWIFQDEEKPTKVKRPRSSGKKMVASFFGRTGHVATIPLEDRRTVNAEWYTTICLPIVFEKVRERRPRGRILLHQDNAPSHNASQTTEFLAASRVELMTHPPYSSDLAPCDFFLFPFIKGKMRGLTFNTSEAAVEAYENLVSEVVTEQWIQCFQNWFHRMQKCIDHEGEYFEKQ